MQRKCDIGNIVKTPWGILEGKQKEIMSGSFGMLKEALLYAQATEFLNINQIAEIMEVSLPTAWKRVHAANLKYLVERRCYLFYLNDVNKLLEVKNGQNIESCAGFM